MGPCPDAVSAQAGKIQVVIGAVSAKGGRPGLSRSTASGGSGGEGGIKGGGLMGRAYSAERGLGVGARRNGYAGSLKGCGLWG